jgi:hypothetical protein
MATSDYWSSADLKGIAFGGLIRQDVLNKIWDISNIPLPFTDMIASDSCSNSYAEWTTDKLSAPDINNAVVDGADSTGNNAKGGARVGNQCQISVKAVAVTQRANASDTIGRANELAYQIAERQKELRRDREAIYLTQQASVADDGAAVAGKLGGLGAWLTSNVNRGVGGANGGFAAGVVATPTLGTERALSETMIRDVAQAVWEKGGNPTTLMSIPTMIRRLSEYMFTSSARIATMMTEGAQDKSAMIAKGSVNVFVTDFGVTLEMIPNRLMQPVVATGGDEHCNVYLIDPMYARESFLEGYRVEELAKTGLADKREMSVDGTLKVLNEEAFGVIADINYTLAVVA